MKARRRWRLAALLLSCTSFGWSGAAAQDVVLEEMLAINADSIRDADGDESDWIELRNVSDAAVDLAGWSLTDDPNDLRRWTFPTLVLAPDARVVVFASGKDRAVAGEELHTSFRLDGDGEFLGLVGPPPSDLVDVWPVFPRQRADVSFGRTPSGDLRYFDRPTPGEPNDTRSFAGLVADTRFSVDRGFYDEPIDVEITTETPEAEIRFTLDGTAPTEANGFLYVGPIPIDRTTVLSVRAFKDDWLATDRDVQTYLFVEDVIRQSRASTIAAGFPPSWGGTSADYGMDQRVIGQDGEDRYEGRYSATIRDDLQSIASLSIVMDVDHMFGPSGIYTNSGNRGPAWERACSAELILPEGGDGFQENCGIRIQGGAFRSHGLTRKHSLRLLFKGVYGSTKLRYPLFGGNSTESFDTITLRANSNDGWQWADAGAQPLYIRDSFGRETVLDMGGVASHERFVHVYINGVYWGLYNAVERPDSSFSATYFGGDKDDWDALSNSQASSGTFQAWNEMLSFARRGLTSDDAYLAIQGLAPDGSDDPGLRQLVDVDNVIDYMITNLWVGNTDWPHKNYWTGFDRVDPKGWKFYMWDSEWSLGLRSPVSQNVVNVANGVAEPYSRLRQNAEFRLRFGDRLHELFSPGGALYTDPDSPQWDADRPERNVPAARFARLAETIESAIVAESARWGDQHRSTPYTRDEHWRPELETQLRTYFPQRSRIVWSQFRAAGLYPAFDPPRLSRPQGFIEPGTLLTLAAPVGEVWYTTDGTDPRLFGGAVSESAQAFGADDRHVLLDDAAAVRAHVPTDGSLGLDWVAPDFDDSSWREGTTGVGFDTRDDYDELIGLDVEAEMYDRNASVYIRIAFDVDPELFVGDRADLASLTLRMRYDDGYVAWLNGERIADRNAPDEELRWDLSARTSHADSLAIGYENAFVDEAIALLRPGRNVLAIQGLNSRPSNNDFLISPRLEGLGAGAAIRLDGTVSLRTRVLDGEQWSALETASYWVDIPLRITEVQFHPRAPDPASGLESSDLEFIELANVGDETIDLRGVRLASAVDFDFEESAVESLAPGEVVVVVSSIEGFASRYDIGSILVAGAYRRELGNAGDRVLLYGPLDEPLLDFTYSDTWHPETDGGGPSLEILDPLAPRESWGDGASWTASAEPYGSPGIAPIAPPRTGAQRIGDIDQDGLASITDAVRLIGSLFGSDRQPLPCGDGTLRAPGNAALADVDGNERVDLNDAVHLLFWQFAGGPPPAAGEECIELPDCPDACTP